MRVLAISHNVISETNNMGKTLLSYLRDFSPDEAAEFYIQDKEPKNADVCRTFYRVTDRDALKSVFGKRVGRAFRITESAPEAQTQAAGAAETIRQYGEKRSPLVFALRNGVWGLSRWNTKELRSWLRRFDPEVILFMSGDFGFMYDVTLAMRDYLNVPLVVSCVDDFYLYDRNEGSAFGRLMHRSYMKSVRRMMDRADSILTISDSMNEAYSALFGKPCHTLHTSSQRRETHPEKRKNKIAYFGNLELGRSEQLREIGRAVRRLGLEGIDGIEVYSAERKPELLRELTEENGVRFHGSIPAAEVAERMDECVAVIHTESFDEVFRERVKYSVSTKIADSLLNGPCLIAYGPSGIASMDYLAAHDAACCINSLGELEPRLRELLTDPALRDRIVGNARALAARNHDAADYPAKVRAWLQEAIDRAAEGGRSSV